MAATGKPLLNELVCNEPRCTQELGRSLDHCREKFTYQHVCSLDDWNSVWQWAGNPPLTISGTCADGSGDCLADDDCADGRNCVAPSSCDVYKYVPAAWEPCRCIQEVFIKPQIDEWLDDVRGLTPAPTADCAAAAFNTIGEALGPMIESGCMDSGDRSCMASVERCAAQWSSHAMKAHCATCDVDAGGSCPLGCAAAQIPCQTWMEWCASATVRFDPLRMATRQHWP